MKLNKNLPLWRHVSFTLMWSSVAASGFGDRMIQLAAWEMLGIDLPGAQASSIQAAVYCIFFIPYLIFSPLGGWLADTFNRKWILLGCDEVRGLLLVIAVFVLPMGVAQANEVWMIYALIFGVGAMAAIFSPTRNATIPQIVPTSQLQSANAVVLGIAVIASMIGLGVGSRIIEQSSIRVGLQIGAGLFLISGSFFAWMKLRTHPRPTVQIGQMERLVQAANYLKHHRRIAQLVIFNAAFWAAANIFLAALAALCKTRYDVPAEQLKSHIADLGMFVGLGMLSSSLFVAWLRTRRETGWLAMLNLFLAALCMIVVALVHSYKVALIFGTLAGFFGNTAMICMATLTQSLTPNYIRGRVFGLRDVLTTLSIVLINALIWQMPQADQWMVPSLLVTSVILALVSIVSMIYMMRVGLTPCPKANIIWHGCQLYSQVWHRLKVSGKSNIPGSGPVIIASNHLTALDPFVLQCRTNRMAHWLMLQNYRFTWANVVWDAIEPICIEHDDANLSQIRKVITVLRQGKVVGLFPEGTLQREKRELQPFAPGIAMIARRSKAVIVPTWIEGSPRARQMIFHFLLPSRTTVQFGKPWTIDPNATDQEVTEELRRRMLELKKTADSANFD